MHKHLATLIAGLALALATTGPMRSSGASRGTVLTPAGTAADCTTDTTLCLQDGRFRVEATWKKSDGSSGAGHPVNLGSDSGYFWFLDPENVELVVKALDGCAVNGHGWFFSGGLTNLEVAISVTDTATGEIRNYANPQGVAFQPIADAKAFGCPFGAPMFGRNPEEPRDDDPATLSAPAVAQRRAGAAPGCDEGDSVLCIDGRFQVEASWQTASGRTGAAHAVSLTSESGYFWFFDPDNVELVVKALDACGIGRGQWFFAAGLTTVAVHIQVTDTFTGEIRTYANPLGVAFRPIQDTAAFAFCATPTLPTFTPTHTPTRTPSPSFSKRTVTPTRTPTRTPPQTITPTPTPTRTPTPGPGQVSCYCLGGDWDLCHFNPSTIHVPVGESVHWTFLARNFGHSTTSGFPGAPDGIWDSGINRTGYTYTFTQAGTFPYFCRVHNERGTVIVDP